MKTPFVSEELVERTERALYELLEELEGVQCVERYHASPETRATIPVQIATATLFETTADHRSASRAKTSPMLGSLPRWW